MYQEYTQGNEGIHVLYIPVCSVLRGSLIIVQYTVHCVYTHLQLHVHTLYLCDHFIQPHLC